MSSVVLLVSSSPLLLLPVRPPPHPAVLTLRGRVPVYNLNLQLSMCVPGRWRHPGQERVQQGPCLRPRGQEQEGEAVCRSRATAGKVSHDKIHSNLTCWTFCSTTIVTNILLMIICSDSLSSETCPEGDAGGDYYRSHQFNKEGFSSCRNFRLQREELQRLKGPE